MAYSVGQKYILEYSGVGKWTGIYVGDNIYGQPTFKITNICEKDCMLVKHPRVAYEIYKDEPLYKDCCICQFICKQDDRLLSFLSP